jgi:phosphatidylethanolamine/phosphatidyl-N-methylethanolamine N-methyltransferase
MRTDTATLKTFSRAIADQFRFIGSLIGNPAKTGAVAPSGAALAKLMASFVDPDDTLPVLELGPGTGVVTKALIERGVAPDRIVAIEYNPVFCRLIAERMPGVTVLEGDAYRLDTTLPPKFAGPFSAIVSSLPLLTRPEEERVALLEEGLARLAKGGPFIQFSYSFVGPVKPIPGRFSVKTSKWVFTNVPPARVWLYSRDR